jgi:hypothetical protein
MFVGYPVQASGEVLNLLYSGVHFAIDIKTREKIRKTIEKVMKMTENDDVMSFSEVDEVLKSMKQNQDKYMRYRFFTLKRGRNCHAKKPFDELKKGIVHTISSIHKTFQTKTGANNNDSKATVVKKQMEQLMKGISGEKCKKYIARFLIDFYILLVFASHHYVEYGPKVLGQETLKKYMNQRLLNQSSEAIANVYPKQGELNQESKTYLNDEVMKQFKEWNFKTKLPENNMDSITLPISKLLDILKVKKGTKEPEQPVKKDKQPNKTPNKNPNKNKINTNLIDLNFNQNNNTNSTNSGDKSNVNKRRNIFNSNAFPIPKLQTQALPPKSPTPQSKTNSPPKSSKTCQQKCEEKCELDPIHNPFNNPAYFGGKVKKRKTQRKLKRKNKTKKRN